MATHAPARAAIGGTASSVDAPSTRGAGRIVRGAVVALIALAVWAAAVVGFELLIERGFGYTREDAWALALGLITYLAGFIGVVTGIVYLVHRSDEGELASGG